MEFQIENIQTLHSTTLYNEEDLVHQNFATKLGLIHGHHRKGKFNGHLFLKMIGLRKKTIGFRNPCINIKFYQQLLTYR